MSNEAEQSICCGAPRYVDWDICAECLEHTDFEEIEESIT